MTKPVWSWVHQPENRRPQADSPGRYSRPLSLRDQVIAEAFGNEVCRLREVRGLSARDLARLVSMSQPWITNIEKGKGNVELRLIWDFADALGVTPDIFLRVCSKAVQDAKTKLPLPPSSLE